MLKRMNRSDVGGFEATFVDMIFILIYTSKKFLTEPVERTQSRGSVEKVCIEKVCPKRAPKCTPSVRTLRALIGH